MRCSKGTTSSTMVRTGFLPARPTGRESARDHPLAERLGRYGIGVDVPAGLLDQRPILVCGAWGDPVHHRGGEVDVVVDPAGQGLVDQGGEILDHRLGDGAVLGQVVAGQDGDALLHLRRGGRADLRPVWPAARRQGLWGRTARRSRSDTMTSRPASRRPSAPRRYAASVTVMVTIATSGRLR